MSWLLGFTAGMIMGVLRLDVLLLFVTVLSAIMVLGFGWGFEVTVLFVVALQLGYILVIVWEAHTGGSP
jgi:hypothetical protein